MNVTQLSLRNWVIRVAYWKYNQHNKHEPTNMQRDNTRWHWRLTRVFIIDIKRLLRRQRDCVCVWYSDINEMDDRWASVSDDCKATCSCRLAALLVGFQRHISSCQQAWEPTRRMQHNIRASPLISYNARPRCTYVHALQITIDEILQYTGLQGCPKQFGNTPHSRLVVDQYQSLDFNTIMILSSSIIAITISISILSK